LVLLERRVDVVREALEQREVGQRRQQAAGQDDLLAADAIRQRAEDQEERRAEHERQPDQRVGRDVVELEIDLDEEQRVELARVPYAALPGRRAQQRQRHELVVGVAQEAVLERGLAALALRLHPAEQRRLVELEADVNGHQQQRNREPERNSPAPAREG